MKLWNMRVVVVGLLFAPSLLAPRSWACRGVQSGSVGAACGADGQAEAKRSSSARSTFPTSAKPAAQAPFLTGVKALYNFEFDIAADAFREAQKADPAFALALLGRGDELQPSAVGAAGSARRRARRSKSWRRPRPPAPPRRRPARSAS